MSETRKHFIARLGLNSTFKTHSSHQVDKLYDDIKIKISFRLKLEHILKLATTVDKRRAF